MNLEELYKEYASDTLFLRYKPMKGDAHCNNQTIRNFILYAFFFPYVGNVSSGNQEIEQKIFFKQYQKML